MKKIINRPETVVTEMCKGLVLTNPDLEFVKKYKVIRKKNLDKNKVSLISGGGSGHEPAHAGCGCLRRCFCITISDSGVSGN